jgi:CubicO group peptidase (beta-lactamase class C family)
MRRITLVAVAVAGMLPATTDAQGTRRPTGPTSAIITDRASALNRRIGDSMSVVLRRALADSAFPGAVAVVGNRQSITNLVTVGRLDARDSTAPSITTIYDLASLTKIVATTTLLLQLVDQGTVALDAPVVRYLPEWKGPRSDGITIRQLLTHSSGLAAWRPFYKEAADRAEARGQLLLVGPEVPPGTRYLYSDMNFMLLGLVIEQVTGMSLDRAFVARVAEPLRLTDTRFRPDTTLRARIAPTEFDPWRQRQLRGEVHDENASRFDGVSGHAGLFSTAADLARVVRMWLNRGTLDGVRFASERTVAEFTRAQDTLVSKRALGWETPTGGNSAGKRLSPGAFGHTGFTGTSIWVDPGRELFLILLTNRVNPTRENRKIGGVRTALADAMAGAADGVAGKTR